MAETVRAEVNKRHRMGRRDGQRLCDGQGQGWGERERIEDTVGGGGDGVVLLGLRVMSWCWHVVIASHHLRPPPPRSNLVSRCLLCRVW